MIVAEVLAWWYAAGWWRLVREAAARTNNTLEFFSMGVLFRTLFDPFRQIDAGHVRGSLQDQWRSFSNRQVSRFIGAIIRGAVIFAGLVSALAVTIFGLVQIVLWPLLPALPFIGLGLMLAGWTW